MTLKYANYAFGNDWKFQHGGAKSYIYHLTQEWCHDNFPAIINKDYWLSDSSDLNLLDRSI